MRVNLYEEEITDEFELVFKDVKNGLEVKRFFGVRFYLESAPALHNTQIDDDRSAVTFWLGSETHCKRFFAEVHRRLANL